MNNPNLYVFRRLVIEMRFLGCSWEDIADATGRSPDYCRRIYSLPALRAYRTLLRDRIAQAIVDLRCASIDQAQAQDSAAMIHAHTRTLATTAALGALGLAPGPAGERFRAWVQSGRGVRGPLPVPPGCVCPVCGGPWPGPDEGDNGPIEGQSGQSDR